MFQLYIGIKMKPKKVQLERLSSNHDGQHPYSAPPKDDSALLNPAVRSQRAEDREAEQDAQARHAHAFDPPSMHESQPIIWIANDSHGLAQHEVAKIRESGVEASTDSGMSTIISRPA